MSEQAPSLPPAAASKRMAGDPIILARQLATAWVDAWNRKDLEAVLEHYNPDVVFVSPRVAARYAASGVGSPDGTIVGVEQLRPYFAEGIEKVANLHLELHFVLEGVAGEYTIYYSRETGAKVVECFKLDPETHKMSHVRVYYEAVC